MANLIKREGIVKCCICGRDIQRSDHYWGNNPEPLQPNIVDGELNVCCDRCNIKYVIPARIHEWSK